MDIVSSEQTEGCGTEGAQVDFRVATTPVGAWTWSSGRFSSLELPVPADTAATPVPTPDPAPDPAPTAAPGMETVDLMTGCNPVASTWPDNTSVQTLDAAVWPPGILFGIWRYDPVSGVWLGYSPLAPEEANDLTNVDRLDAVFFCVDGPATLTRPTI